MTGICRPTQDYTITITEADKVTIVFKRSQKWLYKYGMRNGESLVKVSRDNVSLYLSKDNFENDWEIIKKAEG